MARKGKSTAEKLLDIMDVVREMQSTQPAEPPRTLEPPRERILDGVFDHAAGCRGADYGECTCGVSRTSTPEPTAGSGSGPLPGNNVTVVQGGGKTKFITEPRTSEPTAKESSDASGGITPERKCWISCGCRCHLDGDHCRSCYPVPERPDPRLAELEAENARLSGALGSCQKECAIIAALVPTSSSGQAAQRCVETARVALEGKPSSQLAELLAAARDVDGFAAIDNCSVPECGMCARIKRLRAAIAAFEEGK